MPDGRQTGAPRPSPITMIEPDRFPAPGDPAIPDTMRAAAARVLARDGHGLVLQPWQAAWLIAVSQGREGFVPSGCGVGVGWLRARLDEEMGPRREVGGPNA